MEASIHPPDIEASHTFERKREEQRGLDGDTWAIVKLKNSAPGVPSAIIVEGQVKCLSCHAVTRTLICEDCRAAIGLIRAADNTDVLETLIEFASRPGIVAVLEALTYEAVSEMMMQRIEDARSRD